tara:strand:- start:495 stop:1130 length:636 start_codon:yes stop_codon:yes gene_type:complete
MTGDQIRINRKKLGLTQDQLAKKLGVSKRTIINYEKGETIPDSKSALLHQILSKSEDEALPVDYGNYLQIPLIQHRARAGFLSGWEDPEYVQELPTILWEVDKEYKGRYVCFEVTGDSMDNDSRESIVEKDVLLCREIQRVHWTNKLHLHRWKNFVIVHRQEGILIKRVLEHNTETGRLLLHSLNPLYEDQEVFMDDLIAIFNVIDIKRSL